MNNSLTVDGSVFYPLPNDAYGNERWFIPVYMVNLESVWVKYFTQYKGKKYGKGFVTFSRPDKDSVQDLKKHKILKVSE